MILSDSQILIETLQTEVVKGRGVVVQDFSGQLSLFVDGISHEALSRIRASAETLKTWSGDLAQTEDGGSAKSIVFEAIWDEASPSSVPQIRMLVRRFGHGDWFRLEDPLWLGKPTTAAFYSFKGGVGRTTAMLAFAVQATALNQSVFLIDADLDSPGLYAVFRDRTDSPPSTLGLVDYLLSLTAKDALPLAECVSSHQLTDDSADCYLLHGGTVDANYVDKLSRVDTRFFGSARFDQFKNLMNSIRAEFNPDWILLDTRSGLSDSAALATSGLFDLVVAVATDTEQNWLGITQIASRLGRARIIDDKEQHDCLLVQSLVPAAETLAAPASKSFRARAEQVFRDNYYVESNSDESNEDGRYISIDDAGGSDAPDNPAIIRVNERITQYDRISQVATDILRDTDYEAMSMRILERYPGDPQSEFLDAE